MSGINGELLLRIFRSLVEDMEDLLGFSRGDLIGDYEKISDSVKSRGFTILLVDLPSLCNDLEQALERGIYSGTIGLPFTKKGKPTIFLQIYRKIFTEDWSLRDAVDPEAIRCLRQAFKVFKKYRIDCPESATQEKIHEFRQIEQDLPQPNLSWGDVHLVVRSSFPDLFDVGLNTISQRAGSDFSLESASDRIRENLSILSEIQRTADRVIRSFEFRTKWFRPRHGPGAVSEKYVNSKFEFPSWPQRLETMFPYDIHGMINHGFYGELPVGDLSPPCKLIDVPKDYRGPRLIASEPIASQFIQQGLLKVLRKNVSKSLLRHSIDFSSQEPSRIAALASSVDKSSSTIDLSSASDRLSCSVVESIFRTNFSMLEFLNAARTPDIMYPDGSIEPMRKFAAQGAAFTFPIQSIVYALICIGVLRYFERNTGTAVLARRVRVFGDDMIVPTAYFSRICEIIELLHLRVNSKKSFSEGYFRESCGMDAYSGVDVTPASILTVFNARDPLSMVSLVECSNNLFLKGFIRSSARLLETSPKRILDKVPIVESGSTLWGIVGGGLSPLPRRYNTSLCRNEIRVLSVEAKVRKTTPEGHHALHQWFVEEPLPDSRWSPGEVRSVKARYRLRWVPSYLAGVRYL